MKVKRKHKRGVRKTLLKQVMSQLDYGLISIPSVVIFKHPKTVASAMKQVRKSKKLKSILRQLENVN